MRRIFVVLAVLVGSLFVAVPPASAACVATSKQSAVNRLVDDDELRAYVRFYNRVNYDQCKGYVVLKSITQSFRPYKAMNSRLDCSNNVIDKIRFNPGPIAGLDPVTRTLECAPLGRATTWDVKNKALWSGGDHCTNSTVTVVKSFHKDPTNTFNRVCI